jgi:hypothetical protein
VRLALLQLGRELARAGGGGPSESSTRTRWRDRSRIRYDPCTVSETVVGSCSQARTQIASEATDHQMCIYIKIHVVVSFLIDWIGLENNTYGVSSIIVIMFGGVLSALADMWRIPPLRRLLSSSPDAALLSVDDEVTQHNNHPATGLRLTDLPPVLYIHTHYYFIFNQSTEYYVLLLVCVCVYRYNTTCMYVLMRE